MSQYQLDFDKLQFRVSGLGPLVSFNGLQKYSLGITKCFNNETGFQPKTIGPKELVRWLDEVSR